MLESNYYVPLILSKYDESVGFVDLGEVWALAKEGQLLRVVVRTHPEGWQLCLCRDGQLVRKDVCRQKYRVRFLAARWRANALKAGWTHLRMEIIESFSPAEEPSRRQARAPRSD